jgi:hypothetical protein
MSRLRRPSAPMIVALVALVVALTAPAYAAIRFTKADGRRIVKVLPSNSLTGKKIRESTLARVPRATQADAARTAGRALNADAADKALDADKLDGRDSTGFVSSNLVQRVSAKLAFGEDVQLVANGPVSLRAQCVQNEAGNSIVRVYARTTEADSYFQGHSDRGGGSSAADDFLQPTTGIADSVLWTAEQAVGETTPHVVNDPGKGFVAAKSGAVIAGDGNEAILGLHAFTGGDCAVLARVALDTTA